MEIEAVENLWRSKDLVYTAQLKTTARQHRLVLGAVLEN